MSSKQPRRQTGIDNFVRLYFEAVRCGVTREDFAASIGVKVATVTQRVNDIWELGVNRPDMPMLPLRKKPTRAQQGLPPKQTLAERAIALVQAHCLDDDDEPRWLVTAPPTAPPKAMTPAEELDQLLRNQ